MTQTENLLRGWRTELVAIGRSKGTIAVRLSHVRRFLQHVDLPPAEIQRQHIINWLADHPDWAKDTRRSCVASMRGFWRWAVAAGHVDQDVTITLPTMGRARPLPRPAADYDVITAMREAPPWVSFAVEIMATCGLRRAEVAHLRASDVQPEGQGWTLQVTGKGEVDRVVPCPPHLAMRIRKSGGWVFPGAQNGHVSPGWLGKMVSRHLPEGVTGHKLRHRYASVAYSHTRDLRAIQELLGHASVATTQVYVAVSTADTRHAATSAWKIAA